MGARIIFLRPPPNLFSRQKLKPKQSLFSRQNYLCFVKKGMPYRTRSRTTENATVIEVSIPMRLVRGSGLPGGGEDDGTCYICANPFCASEACGRTMTHLACCTQSICCACLVKSSKRCRCKEDCDAVVSLCPFCREVSAVETLDVFLGHAPPCAACAKGDEASSSSSDDDSGDDDGDRSNT